MATDQDMGIDERYQYLRRMQERYQQEDRRTRSQMLDGRWRKLSCGRGKVTPMLWTTNEAESVRVPAKLTKTAERCPSASAILDALPSPSSLIPFQPFFSQ